MTKTLNMIEDWKQEIAVAWLVKQALMEADQEKIWPYHLPEIAATEADIKEAEAMLGFSLDERYRGFLLHANGWRGFWHTADLFGTSDLVRGPRNENAEFVLAMLDIPHLIRLHPRAADPGKFLPNAAAHEPVITELALPRSGFSDPDQLIPVTGRASANRVATHLLRVVQNPQSTHST